MGGDPPPETGTTRKLLRQPPERQRGNTGVGVRRPRPNDPYK